MNRAPLKSIGVLKARVRFARNTIASSKSTPDAVRRAHQILRADSAELVRRGAVAQ